MATSDLNIVVKAKNEASATLKQVKTDLSGLDKMAGIAVGGIAAAAATVSVAAIAEIGKAITDLSVKAGEVQTLRNSFEGLATTAGQSAQSMLDTLRTASDGMISDADLMLSANKAMLLGVADTADEMAGLLDVARKRGAAMGLSTSQAFNDIVTGLGRESALILDNLGITVDLQKVMDDYAQSLGLTANQLDSVQRKQALVNAVMLQSASMNTAPIDNAATAMQRMNAAIENAKVALGELFGPAIATIAENLASAVSGVTEQIDTAAVEGAVDNAEKKLSNASQLLDVATFNYNNAVSQLNQAQASGAADLSAYEAQVNQAASQLNNLKLQVSLAEGALKSATGAMQEQQYAASGLQAKISALAATYPAAAVGAYQLAQAQAALNSALANLPSVTAGVADPGFVSEYEKRRDVIKQVQSQIDGVASGLVDNLGPDQAIQWGKDYNVEIRKQIDQWREQGYTIGQIQDVLLPSMLKNTQSWAGELDKIGTQSVPKISAEFSNLKSTVESVLSGALDTGVGFSAEDILPREDAINENARRLADIAKNGLTGQSWLGDFANEAPQEFAAIMRAVAEGGDAKQAAALILKDFEDGLRTSLIDKEAAKERVKRMILGEQSMAALATEIATELANEMGIPLQEAMAAAGSALGVPTAGATGAGAAAGATAAAPPDMTGQGAAAGQSFVTGFQTTATGTLLVATMVAQMQTAVVSFQSPGQNAGKTWGAGFMSTVETSIAQPLINLLVTLVTPGVMAQLGNKDTQTTPP